MVVGGGGEVRESRGEMRLGADRQNTDGQREADGVGDVR